MTRLEDLQQLLDAAILAKPETGEDWADICWLEKEIIAEREQEAADNSQFGVGA
jgi:hypothetical protein